MDGDVRPLRKLAEACTLRVQRSGDGLYSILELLRVLLSIDRGSLCEAEGAQLSNVVALRLFERPLRLVVGRVEFSCDYLSQLLPRLLRLQLPLLRESLRHLASSSRAGPRSTARMGTGNATPGGDTVLSIVALRSVLPSDSACACTGRLVAIITVVVLGGVHEIDRVNLGFPLRPERRRSAPPAFHVSNR